MKIISRAEWGAHHPNGFGSRALPATQAWLHHSATLAPDLVPPFDDDYATIRALEELGQTRFGGGISYTRLITPAGLIFEGHSIGRVGSHTVNRNTVAVGYCLVGNYETQQPTTVQLRALAWCLQHDHQHGWLDAPRLDGGHRDLKDTACPGHHLYTRIGDVNQLAAGPPITDQEDDPVKSLILAQEAAGPRVWVGDGITRRHVVDPKELAGLKYWIEQKGGDPTVYEGFEDLRVLGIDVTGLIGQPAPVEIDYDQLVTDVVERLLAQLHSLRFDVGTGER